MTGTRSIPPSIAQPLLYRRLGDGAVLFNPRTWNTHILTPAAAIIYDALKEQSTGEAIPASDAIAFLTSELGVDTDSEEIRRLLGMLRHLGVIA